LSPPFASAASSEVVHAHALDAALLDAAMQVGDGVGGARVVHADACEAAWETSEAFAEVLVVRRERHEHGLVHAGRVHRLEQPLDGRLQLGRVQLVDVSWVPLRPSEEDVQVTVDDLHAQSFRMKIATAAMMIAPRSRSL
jgi:hypothetical protein